MNTFNPAQQHNNVQISHRMYFYVYLVNARYAMRHLNKQEMKKGPWWIVLLYISCNCSVSAIVSALCDQLRLVHRSSAEVTGRSILDSGKKILNKVDKCCAICLLIQICTCTCFIFYSLFCHVFLLQWNFWHIILKQEWDFLPQLHLQNNTECY